MEEQLGVIFDWDGVVIHSEDAHHRSWHVLAAEIGETIPDGAFAASFGMRNQQILPDIFRWAAADDLPRIAELADRKEAIYRDIIREKGITALPGVLTLLESLQAEGVPAVVGTSTPRKNVEVVMAALGIIDKFQDIVSAEDVTLGKPHPDVFLKGAQRIERAPSHCVVIEDAHVGIQAAKAGGIKVLAVATTHPADSLTEADAVHEDLTTVDMSTLRGLLAV